MRTRKFDYTLGVLIAVSTPLFSVALAMEAFPILKEISDIHNAAWTIIATRAITFAAIINAALFFIALNFNRERVAKGVLHGCLPAVVALIYFQFFN